jgi:hypothetical protein
MKFSKAVSFPMVLHWVVPERQARCALSQVGPIPCVIHRGQLEEISASPRISAVAISISKMITN